MKTTLKAIILILLSSFLAGTGQLLWKKVSLDLTFSLLILLNPYLIIGVFVYFLAIIFMVLSFREGELSILHPFLATSFIWVTLISPIFFTDESINLFKIVGALTIFIGISLIGIGGKNNK